jgi:hypothetical protein
MRKKMTLKEKRKRQREAQARWLKKNKGNPILKEWSKKTSAQYRLNHPIKVKAQDIAYYAIRSGKLQKQPCRICGSLKVHAHHPNYRMPLKVERLCTKHHALEHRA